MTDYELPDYRLIDPMGNDAFDIAPTLTQFNKQFMQAMRNETMRNIYNAAAINELQVWEVDSGNYWYSDMTRSYCGE